MDDQWDHWAKLYNEVLDKHPPLKKKYIRGDQLPWITPQLQREVSIRNRLFKLHKRNPSQSSWETFKKQRNKVTSLKRNGIKAFCMDASVNTKHHGEFWSKMKPLVPGKIKTKTKIVLLENDNYITDSLSVAESFNEYFCEIVMSKGDALVVDDFTNHPSIQAIADNNTLQTEFNFVPVEVAYVNDILNKLNPRKAVGCDSISQRLLRILAPVISLPLTNLINHFITNRIRPIV